MLTVITGLFGRYWSYIGLAGVALGAFLWVHHLEAVNTAHARQEAVLQEQRDVAQQVNQQDAQALATLEAKVKEANQVMTRMQSIADARQKELDTIQDQTRAMRGKAGQDAPVAPVLLNTLNQLRAAQQP